MTKIIKESLFFLIKVELIILKYLVLIPIRLIFFFTNTISGYAIMYFLIGGIFLLPHPFPIIILLTFSDLIFVSLVCIILSQFKFSRDKLRDLIGKENFSKYIGDNPGTVISRNLVKVGGVFVTFGVLKIGLDFSQDQVNGVCADNYADRCRKNNVPIDPNTFHEYHRRRWSDLGDFSKKK